jgi:hypothetical protein
MMGMDFSASSGATPVEIMEIMNLIENKDKSSFGEIPSF